MHGLKESFSLQPNTIAGAPPLLPERFSHTGEMETLTLRRLGEDQDTFAGRFDSTDSDRMSP